MISTPQTLIVGGTSVTTGFIPPGYVEVIGNINASNTVTPQPPEIQAINLLSPTLDSRVSYHGPAHTYVNVNGNLLTSAVNEWPLEYQNGVAVGRHEPEPAATNYAIDSAATNIAGPGVSAIWMFSEGTTVTITASNGSQFPVIGAEARKTFLRVFNEADAGFLTDETDPGTGTEWERESLSFNNDTLSDLRFYPLRENASSYVYQRCQSVPTGNMVASVFRKLTPDVTMQITATQVESGNVPTSPIFNDAASQNSRDASTVIVTNPGGATGITIIYSDGTTQSLSFGTSQSVNIPVASQAWGSRYITQITYSTS